jgi:hypothetical protein
MDLCQQIELHLTDTFLDPTPGVVISAMGKQPL